MIDDQSEAGSWADAIAHSHCLRVEEYDPARIRPEAGRIIQTEAEHTMKEGHQSEMNRAEWIAAAALGINILGFAFGGGALWQSVNEQGGEISELRAKDSARDAQMTQILVRLERIDANTIALKDRVDGGAHK